MVCMPHLKYLLMNLSLNASQFNECLQINQCGTLRRVGCCRRLIPNYNSRGAYKLCAQKRLTWTILFPF